MFPQKALQGALLGVRHNAQTYLLGERLHGTSRNPLVARLSFAKVAFISTHQKLKLTSSLGQMVPEFAVPAANGDDGDACLLGSLLWLVACTETPQQPPEGWPRELHTREPGVTGERERSAAGAGSGGQLAGPD